MRLRQRQNGISLITVLVLLLMSLMAVMGSFRVANLNEAILGSSTDYSRTFAAAEALMADAEIDIRGRIPPYTMQSDKRWGLPCVATAAGGLLSATGYVGCRNQAVANTPWFPEFDPDDFDAVSAIVNATIVAPSTVTKHCKQGICVPLNATELANIETDLTNMTPLGATYGQFTRANAWNAASGVSGNPILNANPAQAWYWVEVFRYTKSVAGTLGASAIFASAPSPDRPFVFRITVVAQGLKAGTQVVLRGIFVPSIDPI
jgi:type IV pilus assembly protein PilX